MPTEVACFYSHFNLWKRIAHEGRAALVLEDDVVLASNLPDFINQITGFLDADHISLETRLRKKLIGDSQTLSNGWRMARLYQDRTGAAAYILWPEGAAQLVIQAESRGAALADAFISNIYKWRSWQVMPALAIQSDVAVHYGLSTKLKTHSYIQAQDKKINYKAKGQAAFNYKLRRIASQIRQGLRFITHIRHARRILIGIQLRSFAPSSTHEKTT